MGSGFSRMKKQAKLMQEQITKKQNDLKEKMFEGVAANGLVVITMNGEKEVKSIKIDPKCVDPNDIDGLQDLIIIAFRDADQKIKKEDDSDNFSLENLF
ncbi:MAG: YbaB/EbfC family nucleoid-associated protein [Parachlamydiales bacterium]|jgi:hypothetical protein